MQSTKNKTAASDALAGIWAVLLTIFVVAVLYFGRELLIPLALASLLTFLLSPVVSWLERWIGRIVAVLLVVVMIFGLLGAAGWMVTHQLVDLAAKLPQYKDNITAKIHSIQTPKSGAFAKFSQTMQELKKELPGQSGSPPPTIAQEAGKPETAVALPPHPPPMPVQVIETSKANPIELIKLIIAPLLGPLGTAVLVLILVIFMLLQREDLRNRLVRLIGQGRISATTRALDDAGHRVSRYLLMQLLVNLTYGTVIAVGLSFIGVPNALLWGALATVLRFIPYLGPWIATILPTLLALAVSRSWTMPILTVALFGGIELLLNNVMEPLLYGAHTGVSSMALIVAAVFWTWLWGPLGLVLTTPLTVCLVVIGRHVPRLSFLSVVLSDEEPLTPAEECYQRLLALDLNEASNMAHEYVKTHSLTALYDSVFIPVITSAEMDRRRDAIDEEQRSLVEQGIRDLVEDFGSQPPPEAKIVDAESSPPETPPISRPALNCRVFCLPARAERDELAAAMLMQLLRQQGFGAQNAPAKLVAGEMIELVVEADVDVVCISVVPPSTVVHARYLCLKLRSDLPRQKIVVGLWGTTENVTEAATRLREAGTEGVVTSLADALVEIAKLAPELTDEMTPAPIPADEEERLAALAELNLLDTEAEPFFDRITAKLTRVFEVPIAAITFIDRERQFFKSQTGLPEDLAKARQTPRNVSVCGHVVAKNQVMVIEDLARDRRFANNPLLKEHGIRFYAGVPLLAPNGQPIGSLCLLDLKPREMTEREKRLLLEYANEVMEEIAKRAPARLVSVPEMAT